MNWDWDKLTEKRQQQQKQGWKPAGKGDRDESSGTHETGRSESDDTGEEPRRPARRIPMRGGGGNGGGGGKEPFQGLRGFTVPGAKWWALGLLVLWGLSGIYIVQPDEAGVVLRFGQYVRTTGAGPHYHLPVPIEQVYRPKVSQIRQAEVGYRSQSSGGMFQQGRVQAVDEESAMLTGDENIVQVQFNIQYHLKPDGAVDYLFNVHQPDVVVKKAAEAAMREVIGKNSLDAALTSGRVKIQDEVTEMLQGILDKYQVGVQVVAVQMQNVQPPYEVRDAFKDVASAREDKERVTNEAEAYRRDILPKAIGSAAQIVNEAEAYRQTRVRSAEGEASRFLAVLEEYSKAQDVTRKRMLFEAMEEVLSRPGMDKLILPSDMGDSLLPLLPLGGVSGSRQTGGLFSGTGMGESSRGGASSRLFDGGTVPGNATQSLSTSGGRAEGNDAMARTARPGSRTIRGVN